MLGFERLQTFRWNVSLVFIAIVVLWLSTSAAKIFFNGLIFDFDYGLYHPDGTFYTFRALLFAGYDKVTAGNMVAEWYSQYPARPRELDPTAFFFENAPSVWDQYYLRILYPLLSAPFVKLMGIPGMLVVPSLTYLVMLLITGFISLRLGRPGIGILVSILITCSATVSRWMYANITDGLLMLFTTLFIILIYKKGDLRLSKLEIFIVLGLVVLSSLTRFSALLWISVALVFILRKRIVEGLLIFATATLSALPVFLRPFGDDVLPELNQKSFLEKVLLYPISLAKITIYEIGQLFVLDRIFFWMLLLSFVLSVLSLRSVESQLFILTTTSLWITGSLNAVAGVNFRYQLAMIPFLLWVLISRLPRPQWTFPNRESGSAAEGT